MGWGTTDTTRRELYWQSLTIPERLDHVDYEPVTGISVPDEWVGGVDGLTKTHLRWWLDNTTDHVPKEVMRSVVETDFLPDQATFSVSDTWVTDLDALITHITDQPPLDTVEHGYRSDGSPFVHFISSIITYARTKLFNQHNLDVLTPDNVTGLHDQLLEDFIELAGETLYTEFRTTLLLSNPSSFSPGGQSTEDTEDIITSPPRPTADTSVYESFIEELHTKPGLRDLFARYPVLGRWTLTLVDQWVETVVELDTRLSIDWKTLVTEFTDENTDDVDVSLETVTADSHGHGRTVIEVHIGDTPVMYKPKPVDTEVLLNDFLQQIEDATSIEFYEKTIVDRDTYGWVEYIGHEPASTIEDIHTYYQRAGGLLAASYLLFLNDGHYENVVAHGSHPVLLDTETILYPEINVDMFSDTGESRVDASEMNGVYWTGLLEQYRDGGGGANVDINGFVKPRVPVSYDNTRNQWEHTNTDEMVVTDVSQRIHTIDDPDNIPTLNGELHGIDDYVSDVQHGFTTTLEAIIDNDVSVTEDIDELETRLVLRDTSEYVDVLSRMQSPNALTSGRETTYVLDELLAAETVDSLPTRSDDETGRDVKRVISAERTSLKRLDVPRFTVEADTGVVKHDDTRIETLVGTSGVERVRERFDSVTPGVVKQQRDIIQLTVTPSRYESSDSSTDLDVSHTEWESAPDTLRDAADRIYSTVVDSMARENSWLVRSKAGVNTLDIHEIDDDVYEGRLGIALFAAYYDYAFDHKPAYDLATTIGDIVEETVRETSVEELVSDVGFGSGIAAYVYGFTALGRATKTQSYIDTAKHLALNTDFDDFDSDEIGVMGGEAGLLNALLALYETTNDARVLDRAKHVADNIIVQEENGEWTVTTLQDVGDEAVMTGVAHGTSGVLYALARLNYHAPANKYQNAVEVIDEYQQTQYDDVARNWPDTRDHTSEFMDAWCHGRTGVVTTRYAATKYGQDVPTDSVYADAKPHIVTNLGTGPDQLCCGTTGRVNNLVSLANETSTTAYGETARAFMRDYLGITHRTPPTFELQGHTPRLTNPTLFQGLTGVGYSILRVLAGTDIPNVQLFE